METNKKQTALDWLQEQIKDIQPYELACTIEQYIEEAKQMEREQIQTSNHNGWLQGPTGITSQEYYEKTYGKNEKN